MMLAYSSRPQITLRLPIGNTNTSLVHIIIHIRDVLNAVTEYPLHSVLVQADTAEVTALTDVLQQTDVRSINQNPTIQVLSSGNPNVVSQVLTAVSQVFNQINHATIENAVSSKEKR